MESCISLVVTNIFMEHIGRQAFTTFREPPKFDYVMLMMCFVLSNRP